MNCPDCDNLTYQSVCPCGWIMPPITTIEIKSRGVSESNYPVKLHPSVALHLKKAPQLTGKAYAEYCIDYAKKLLKSKV